MTPPPPDAMALGPGRQGHAAMAGGSSRWQRIPWAPAVIALLFSTFLLLPRVRENPHLTLTYQGVTVFLLAWTLLLWLMGRQRTAGFPIEFATPLKSHYIQASVQICIYLYWGWYWRDVYAEAPLILSQFVFLYAFDALLSWSRGRPWRLGFGPLPIILSTNIFIWFKDDWYVYQFLLVAVGALGKEFVKWTRDGRRTHIFNPSAFTLALFSLVLIFSGTSEYTWGSPISTTVSRPPHIYLLMFALGLVVQYFFSVTLMTLSAFAALFVLGGAYHLATDSYYFVDSNIPVALILGLSFLMTDPSTSPRTNAGKIIFGALYGSMVFAMFELLEHFDVPPHYDKLLPVPILNLSVQAIDRVAKSGIFGRFSRWEARFPARRLNFIHMACFAALFVPMMVTGYVGGPHEGSSIGYWKRAVAEGKPNAARSLLEVVAVQADAGSGAAWNELGLIYLEGKLVPRNATEGARCFAKACQLGDPFGCLNLADQYLFKNVPYIASDVALAFDRLERECGPGTSGKGCYLLGLAYERGKGRPENPVRAAELYQEACQRGNMDACKAFMRLRAVGGSRFGDAK